VLADNMARSPDDPAAAMRPYERARHRRTGRVQHAAHSNGRLYHLTAGEAWARNLFLRVAGGKMLLRRYNWLYDWRTALPESAARPRALPRWHPDEG
jgi:salicylate hydroxylase